MCCMSMFVLVQAQQAMSDKNFKSTEVLPNNKVAFRIYAPEANNVKLVADGIWDKVEFKKDKDGVWEGIYSNVQKGAYHYHFVVDGVNVYDPMASSSQETKALLLVGNGHDFFGMRKDIPHGAMSQRYYFSNTLNKTRRVHIWTPAGFEKSKEKLPVLYLIHGGGGTDMAWSTIGCAGNIFDNLLAEGKIEPMIVVMPNGTIETEHILDRVPLFKKDFMNDLVPFIEENYPTYADAKHRAIMGLSMGGLETLEVVTNHPDEFSYIGVLSSGWWLSDSWKAKRGTVDDKQARLDQLKKVSKVFKQSVELLYFTQGGKEDLAYDNGMETLDLFKEAGITYKYSERPGGHSWLVWRKDLRDISQLLFK